MRRCVDCGAVWPDEVSKDWGRHKETNGYGPRPRCVALVPVRDRRDGAQQVCGGELAFISPAQLQFEDDELTLAARTADEKAAEVRTEVRQLTPL